MRREFHIDYGPSKTDLIDIDMKIVLESNTAAQHLLLFNDLNVVALVNKDMSDFSTSDNLDHIRSYQKAQLC